jgi:hypothetical protein
MKSTRRLLILAAMMGYALVSFAGGRGPLSTTVVGHIAVTLLSPAALTDAQNLQFNDIDLKSTAGMSAGYEMKMGSIKVVGNQSTYAVTVSGQAIGFSQNGTNLSVDNFSTTTNSDNIGNSSVNIGATINRNGSTATTYRNDASPLAVTINYN